VISEIWGVHEYIKDSTRRFAKAGYYAIAPELFVREGGVAQLPNVQDVLKIVLAQKREQTLGDLKAAVDWAKTRPNVKADRVGVTGWCWGGSTTMQVAGTNADMKAAVAWYGPPSRPYQGASGPVTGFDLAKDIKIPFLGPLWGDRQESVARGRQEVRFGELVSAQNKNVEIVVYLGAGHGFHADYRPSYNKAAADDAWNKCVGWLNKYLKG
jgi:carboxymethylenebutenolidase